MGYRGLIPDAYLDAMRPEERASRYTFGRDDTSMPMTFVAEDERGGIIGFATIGQPREVGGECVADLLALYVDPVAWGQGYGTLLLTTVRNHLSKSGIARAFLWIISGNQRAQRLYERDGWRLDGQSRFESYGGTATVKELRLQRKL